MKKVVCLFIACLLLLASLGTSLAEVVEIRSEETSFIHHNAAIFGGEQDASMYLKITYPADFDAEKTYPVVIGSHGFNANSMYFDMLWTETLAKNGYLVYTFDFCGGASLSGDGELMLTILSAFAQEESKSASDNQRWRIRKGFEDGELMCLRTMFGYRISKEDGIEIDPEQAQI